LRVVRQAHHPELAEGGRIEVGVKAMIRNPAFAFSITAMFFSTAGRGVAESEDGRSVRTPFGRLRAG